MQLVDTHQHLWSISERPYEWLTPHMGVLYRDFRFEDVANDAQREGVAATILVQAADTYADTFAMLSVAKKWPAVSGVVGWVPLDRPTEAAAALQLFATEDLFKGVRALSHDYGDPHWILRADVSQSIAELPGLGMSLDYVTSGTGHLGNVPELARRHPELTIVVDHLGKPDIKNGQWEPWASMIVECARYPNVNMKISGLNTVSSKDWTPDDWQPYVDHVVEHFGSQRLMFGSDWPVSLLNGTFEQVWKALRHTVANLRMEQQEDIYYRTAARVYKLADFDH